MYNLNVNPTNQSSLTTNNGLLSVTAAATASAEVTPRTPEIVNSLMAMTNPFDGFTSGCNGVIGSGGGNNNNDESSRADSTSSGEPSPPPSIQHTCSQLIKEGLKLTLQTKRRANGIILDENNKKRTRREYGSADDKEDDESSNGKSIIGLTPEDEERRRRRRERNKIAATKCRLKKREKTVILVQESETLESQNHELKSQIQELETQRRRLVDMLNLHGPTCIKQQSTCHNEDTTYQQQYTSSTPLPSYQENFVPGLINQTSTQQNCVSNFVPIKIEGFEANAHHQDYFARHHHHHHQQITTSHYEDLVESNNTTVPTNVTNDRTNCVA